MRRCLVTAGNTREMIDRVRDWGNIFTGNTGFAIARALRAEHEVDLLTSNADHLQQAVDLGISTAGFRSHADLMETLRQKLAANAYDAIFMTAAVADYAPAGAYAVTERVKRDDGTEQWIVRDAQAAKVKSDFDSIAILGQRTAKIVDQFRSAWGYRGLLVKFKLEVDLMPEALLTVAEKSRVASGADYLVANTLDMVSGAKAGAYLLSSAGHEWLPRADLPARCAALVTSRRA